MWCLSWSPSLSLGLGGPARLWERMFMLGSRKYKAPTRAAPQVFPDICAGHKQLKPACIPPVGPYPTTSSPHSHSLVSWMCWSTMTPTSPSLLGAKMPLGSLLQGHKWPEAETCSISAPHHLAGEGGCDTAQPPEQTMEQKMPQASLTKQTRTGRWMKRERDNCASDPTNSLPVWGSESCLQIKASTGELPSGCCETPLLKETDVYF